MAAKKRKIEDFFGKPRATDESEREHDDSETHVEESAKEHEERTFKDSWLKLYSWLRFEKETMSMYCVHCKAYPAVAGKTELKSGSRNFKKETLKLHNESKKHKLCRDASLAAQHAHETGVSPAQNLFRGADSKIRQDLEMKMSTAYFIAKEELPFTKFDSLLALQRKNGVELSKTYSSDVMCAEMISTISDVMSDNLRMELQKTNFLCVMIDGATDTSIRENEAIVVRYLSEKGESKTKLVGLRELEHAHADGVFETIKTAFSEIGVENFAEKVVSFCSDGASVNMGKKSSVSSRLKELCPWLISTWCLPHRLELAFMDMLKKCKEAENVIDVLHLIYKTYHYSPKSRRELKVLGEQLGVSIKNPSRVKGTRWTPHLTKALETMLSRPVGSDMAVHEGQYSVIFNHLGHLTSSKNNDIRGRAVNLVKKMDKFVFVAFCHFLCDLLGTIKKLSLDWQRNDIILPMAINALMNCYNSIQNLKHHAKFGGMLQIFIRSSERQLCRDNNVLFEGIKLVGAEQISLDYDSFPVLLRSSINSATELVINCLDNRFSELLSHVVKDEKMPLVGPNGAINAFHVFYHDKWPVDPTELSMFGDEEVSFLANWFKEVIERSLGHEVDINNTIHQWGLLKQLIATEFMDKTYTGLWTLMITKEPYKTNFKDVLKLPEIMLTIPVSSAQCERTFSAMKRIKNDTRSCLNVDTVCDLIKISGEGECLEKFDPKPSVGKWFSSKRRRCSYQQWPREDIAFIEEKDVDDDEFVI